MRWETFEYHHTEKTVDWFWAVGIIAVSIAATAIIFGNLLLGILILVATTTLCLYAARKPEIITVEINDKGVVIHNLFHPYASLDSFWVEEMDHRPKVLIKSKKILMPYIILALEDNNPDEVREYLLNFLKEEEHHEPLLQKLMEYVGF